jgi:hypothetical protein
VCAQPHRQELIQDLYKTWHDPQRGIVTGGMIRYFSCISPIVPWFTFNNTSSVKTIHDFTPRRQVQNNVRIWLSAIMHALNNTLSVKTIHSFTLRRRSRENRTMCAFDYLSSCIGESVKQSIQLEIIVSQKNIRTAMCGNELDEVSFLCVTLYRELLISFRKATGQKPLRIIFYRYFTMHVRYLLLSIKGLLMPHVHFLHRS